MKRLSLLILALTIYFNTSTLLAQDKKQEITLEDIWLTKKFTPNKLAAMLSLNDGKSYAVLESNQVNVYSYETGKKLRTVIDARKLKTSDGQSLSIDEFSFNANESKLLIAVDQELIYRHSSKSWYYVWDIATQQLQELSKLGKLQLPLFSPTANKVAFVRDNNMFVKNLDNGEELQITNDGEKNKIINGSSDWVYEEEFGLYQGYHWSPDGSQLAFLKFDESKVKEYNMQMWGELYPQDYKYKYPKAGEDNSIVGVYVYDLKSANTTKIDVGDQTDQYIPNFQFTNDSKTLSVLRMNRLQNLLEVLHANTNDGTSSVVYKEENARYVDLSNFSHIYLSKQPAFIITSEKDGWNHAYLVNYKTKQQTQLTTGQWEITDVKGVDEKTNKLYFISTEDSPLQRQLFEVKLDATAKTKLSVGAGTHSVEFSSDYTYYIDTYSSANAVPIISLYRNNGKLIKTLVDNAAMKDAITKSGYSKKQFFSFRINSGSELNGFMIKPTNMQEGKRYPVLMVFYGGPGSQQVADKWGGSDLLWYQYLAQKGYIIACVDGRGTGFRGEEFKKCTYLQLGNLETVDQIETAKYLGSLEYVDKDRIGVWGWSFGGYLSTLCMTKGADYFKAGIAVAPVTNWRYYDNVYTERFMRKPQDNSTGYDENAPITHVSKLKGSFLLVHGTADDNVHVQNSYELIDALVKNNKQFEMQFYTNKNHSIYGGNTRFHLYKRMSDFVVKNL